MLFLVFGKTVLILDAVIPSDQNFSPEVTPFERITKRAPKNNMNEKKIISAPPSRPLQTLRAVHNCYVDSLKSKRIHIVLRE